jgi:hypothetical protein
MVRATRTRRREKISLPLTTVVGSLRKKLLGVVDQMGAGWNQLANWMKRLDSLRQAN